MIPTATEEDQQVAGSAPCLTPGARAWVLFVPSWACRRIAARIKRIPSLGAYASCILADGASGCHHRVVWEQRRFGLKGTIMASSLGTHAATGTKRRWSARRVGTWALGGLLVLLLGMQLVPYGRDHTNPPVVAEPTWDSPATRAMFVRACADCHSNQTVWPWYSNIAPVSWLITRDVIEGRQAFNVSEWGRQAKNEGEDAAETVREGEMPLWFYLPLHPEARLTPAEQQQFIAGLTATFGGEGGGSGGEVEGDD